MIVAFTGHRPDKLGGYEIPNPTYNHVIKQLTFVLKGLQPKLAITGMAQGVDTWAAELCVKLEIPYIAAIPFEGQEKFWPTASKEKYRMLLDKAKRIHVVSPGSYTVEKMYERNKWMVQNCKKLIAIWDGSKGGTAHCVKYAKNLKREIILIDPKE